jgi:hypothetical protein
VAGLALTGGAGLVFSVSAVSLVPLNGGEIVAAVTTGSAILGISFSVARVVGRGWLRADNHADGGGGLAAQGSCLVSDNL